MVAEYLNAGVMWIEGEDTIDDGLYVVTQDSDTGTKVISPSQLNKAHDNIVKQVEFVREQ